MDKVYIVVLNYNNWQDTIVCLESLRRIDYGRYAVVAVDNFSSDGSYEALCAWAKDQDRRLPELDDGLAKIRTLNGGTPRRLSFSSFPRPDEAEAACENDVTRFRETDLILVRTEENLGFAGGCNVGLRIARTLGDGAYYLLLNNDSIQKADFLTRMVRCFQAMPENVGILGSVILDYDRTDMIQSYGGVFDPRFVVTKHFMQDMPYDAEKVAGADTSNVDYVIGAAMMLKPSTVEAVGYLSEAYFLYYEEIDYVLSAERAQIGFGLCPDSLIYHKKGGTINKNSKGRSQISQFYSLRNRIVLAGKFFKHRLPTVYLGLFIAVFNRVRRGDFRSAWLATKVLLGKNAY